VIFPQHHNRKHVRKNSAYMYRHHPELIESARQSFIYRIQKWKLTIIILNTFYNTIK